MDSIRFKKYDRKNEHTLIKVNYKGFTWDVDASIFIDHTKREIIEYLRRYFDKQMSEMISDIMRLQRNHTRYRERSNEYIPGSYSEYDADGNVIGYYTKHRKRMKKRNGSR